MPNDKVTWETIVVVALAVMAVILVVWIMSLTPPTV